MAGGLAARWWWAAAVTAVSALVSACSAPVPEPVATPVPVTVTTTTVLEDTTAVAEAMTTVTAVAGFSATVGRVTAADLGSSWRPGCPVSPDELRSLDVSIWGFDDRPHRGSIVVAASVADAVVSVFRALYDERFPVRRMEPVHVYGSDDDASMAADNTSGFNCRNAVADGPPHFSSHAFGLAIDVNPVENPYLLGDRVLPPAGVDYLDRSVHRPGMAVHGGVLTSAFAAAGWSWGGEWSGNPDYQHFSASGG